MKEIPKDSSIDLAEIVGVLQKVLLNKESVEAEKLNQTALLNVFKIGTSAGGARPKILISEHKKRVKLFLAIWNIQMITNTIWSNYPLTKILVIIEKLLNILIT